MPNPAGLTPPRPWAFLTDAELNLLKPYFTHGGAGRPMHDLRARLDAIFWAVTHNGPWRDLPAEMGPWDTASRQFRRWAHKGVWTHLLKAASRRASPLHPLLHWLCRAFRRAWRILGLEGIRLARRLGLHSALRGPLWMLPDPDLSDQLLPTILARVRACIGRPARVILPILRAARSFHFVVGGRPWVPRALAPP